MTPTARRPAVLVALLSVLALVAPAPPSSATLVEHVTYAAHVQSIGWQAPVSDGSTAGTIGRSLRVEAIRLAAPSLRYRAHVQGVGWQPWVSTGAVAGTTGRGLRLEAFQVTAPAGAAYRVEYRARVQTTGWMPWVHDGATAGTTGRALRVEALQVRLVEKAPPVTDPLRIAVTADNGLDATASTLFSSIGRSGAAATFVLGDLAYVAGREADYCRMVTDRVNAPTEIVAGNHEGDVDLDGSLPTYTRCLPGRLGEVGTYGRDYYVDRGPARVILISPAIPLGGVTKTYRDGTPEQAWLTAAIRGAHAAGRWPVVGMHAGCFTLGVHGCASTPELTDLLIREEVPLVLQGHDHVYARTQQLTGTVAAPRVVDRDGSFARTAGTVFVVIGNGGHNPRTVAPLTPLWASASGTNSTGGITFGYGRIDIAGGVLSWRLVRTSGGSLADSFTIR